MEGKDKPEQAPASQTGDVATPEAPTQKVEAQFTEAQVKEAVKKALDEQYAKLNTSMTKLGQENKKLREQSTQTGSSKISPEFLTLMEQMATGDYVNDPTFLAKVQTLRAEENRKETLARMEQVTNEARAKIEQKIRDAGFDPEEGDFDGVWDKFDLAYAVDGKFERADKKLDKILATKKKPEPTKEPKDVEEAARKMLEEQGKLTTEMHLPSGVTSSWLDFERDYVAGKIPYDVYEKRARQEGKI